MGHVKRLNRAGKTVYPTNVGSENNNTVKARSLKHSNLNGLLVCVMGEIKCNKTSYIQMYCSSNPENILRENGEVQQDK